MKIILLLLSFVFVSCVTANTGKRDLSGINEKPAQEQTLIEDKKRPHRNLSSHKGPACGSCYTCCKVEGYSDRECAEACSSDRQD